MFIFLLVPLASAWEWDNVKDYNEETQTITVTNALGLGDTIATLKLVNGKNKILFADDYFAEIEFDVEDNYESFLQGFELYEKKSPRDKSLDNSIQKDITFKYYKADEEWIEEYTKTICVESKDYIKTLNNSNIKCIEEQIIKNNIGKWIEYNTTHEIEKGIINLRLYTNVEAGKIVEWIPTFFGVRIDEWTTFEGATIFHNFANQSGLGEIGQPQHNGVDGWTMSVTRDYVCESFRVQDNFEIVGVEILGKEKGAGTFDVRIRNIESDGEPGDITHTINSSFNVDPFPDASFSYINISLPPVILNASTNYSLCLDATVGNGYIDWGKRGLYNETGYVLYGTSYTSMTIVPNDNVYFRIYGVIVNYSPFININFPLNNSQHGTPSLNFTYNVSDADGDVVNCSLYIDTVLTATDTTVTQVINQSFNVSVSIANHNWLVGCYDGTIWGNSTTYNFSVLINTPDIDLQLPNNNSYTYAEETSFIYNVSDLDNNIANCSLFINGVENQTDLTITQTINQSFNITLGIENINWSIGCWDISHYQSNSSNYNYSRLIVLPKVELTYPIDLAEYTTRYINFTYNVSIGSGRTIDSCSLYIDTVLTATDTTITQTINQTFNTTLNNSHYWGAYINCESNEGYKANSSAITFRFNTPPTIPIELQPTNNTIIFDTSQYLVCNGSVDGEDTPNYAFWGGISTTSMSLLQNSSLTYYTWTGLTSKNYYWRCRSNDNVSSSSYTDTRRLIILGSGQFNISNNEVCNDNLVASICWDYKDEINRTSLEASIAYNFKIGLSNSSTFNFFGEYNNVNTTCLCINNSLFSNYSLQYGEIQYSVTGYANRRYYVYSNTRLSGLQINDTLFSLPTGSATSFLFNFESTALQPYVNKYLALLRWYPDLNLYDVVEMAKTDDKGQSIMRVEVEDTDYRTGLYHFNGSLIKLLSPVRFACLSSPCSYSSLVEEDEIDYTSVYGVETNLEFIGDTFYLTYSDPSQLTNNIQLDVFRESGALSTIICSSSTTGNVGVLTCNASGYAGNLRAIAYRTASPTQIIAQVWANSLSTVFRSSTGLFISAIIFMSMMLIGIFNPVLAIVLGVVGLIPAVVFGALSAGIAISIGVLGAIVIHFMKRVS